MKVLTLILVALSMSGCYRCSYGISSNCDEGVYSEEGKMYQKEYDAKVAKQAAEKKALDKNNSK